MKNRILLIIMLLFSFFVIFKFDQKRKNNKSLRFNYIMQSGVIDSFRIQFKSSSCYIYYTFIYDGKKINSEQELYGVNCNEDQNKFICKSFAVAIDKTNPSNSFMLITPNHFKKIGIEFPDSLKWVLKYYDGNFINL